MKDWNEMSFEEKAETIRRIVMRLEGGGAKDIKLTRIAYSYIDLSDGSTHSMSWDV